MEVKYIDKKDRRQTIAEIAYRYCLEHDVYVLDVGQLQPIDDISGLCFGGKNPPDFLEGTGVGIWQRRKASRVMRAIKHSKSGQKLFRTTTYVIYNGLINAPVISAYPIIKEEKKEITK